jgi:uncharacterized protein (TIGR02246 family)
MAQFTKILWLALVVAVISCKPTGRPMTNAEKLAIEKTIEATTDHLASAISRFDVSEVMNLCSKTAGTEYIGDGEFISRGELRAALGSFSGRLRKMNFVFEKKQIRALNPDMAVLTAWAHYEAVTQEDQKLDDRAIFTVLYVREHGKWCIVQAHKSLRLSYQSSETSKARPRLGKFCQGNGIDLGFGGDPILPSAITMDLPKPYTKVGGYPQNLAGDARNLYWFKDNVLDYVYASHLLEDFPASETALVIREWLRVTKVGGVLVLYGPDQQAYMAYCKRVRQAPNAAHKIKKFGLKYLKEVLETNFQGSYSILHEIELVDDYCFDLVVKKLV